MRLYHVPNTRGSRVIWTFEETGAPYDVVRITREETKEPEHLARHPLGKVPVLEDDEGGLLIESAAQLLHIADLHPEAGLIAAPGTRARALAYQWMFFAMTELEPQVVRVLADRESGPERAQAAEERVRRAEQVIEDALDGQDYLVADTFGVADIVASAVLFFAQRFELVDGFPRIEAYLARLGERTARRRALEIASA